MQESDPHGGGETGGPPPEAVGLRTHPLTAVTSGLLLSLPAAAALVFGVLQNGDVPDLPWWLLVLVPVAMAVGGFVAGTAFGYVRWYFTTYVIDGEELRVESGVLWKSSRRVPYERLQSVDIAEPLLARVVGLCELRMETAGGSDSRTALQYLRLADARALRRVLLDRAHGTEEEHLRDAATGTSGTPARDPDTERQVLLRVTALRLVLGTLVSLDFAVALVGGLAFVGALLFTDLPVAALGGLIPFATVVVRIVATRVAAQWDSTLSADRRGLRIERGLLSRTSQTVPWERIQGLAVEEPLVWRRLRWARLRVDVAGYGNETSDDSGEVTSTLVPVADRDVVLALVDRVLHARPDDVERTRAPGRSWPFAPLVWRFRWIGAVDAAFVGVEGWLQRRTNVVPHHKTQSVEIRQGPLARRLMLATVEVHTPDGPVDANGRNLDSDVAAGAAFAQLDRARRARGESAG